MPTGVSHPRCYAGSLCDCSKDITREHYISKSLIEVIGEKPEIAGLKFQAPKTLQSLGIQAMTAKVLCQRHNNMLSPLDAEATRFFQALRDFDRGLGDAAESETAEVVVDGDAVERWMLKLLAGLVFGKLVNVAELRRDSSWLQILFGEEDWPAGWGLHFVASAETFFAFDGLEVETRAVRDELWAAMIGLGGLKFYLTLGTPEGDPSLRRRPSELIFRRPDRDAYKRLELQWKEGPSTGWGELSRAGEYDGDRPQDRHYKRVH